MDVHIANTDKTRAKDVKGLIDAGATLTTIPRVLADELGIQTFMREQVETGAGNIEIDKGRIIITIGKKEDIQTIWISDIIDKVLIGCVTLEMLGIKVNPVIGKIEETPLMLY
ncbi:MAG: aspartyl protease [Elusimicrobia bacterium]|nr:aspartyl protease [Elusimicrobiota bacterium]